MATYLDPRFRLAFVPDDMKEVVRNWIIEEQASKQQTGDQDEDDAEGEYNRNTYKPCINQHQHCT